MACAMWGVDTTTLTIWKKKGETKTTSNGGNCSSCNTCRLLRSLEYCSSSNFLDHKVIRDKSLSKFGVVVVVVVQDLDINDSNCFP